MHEVLSPIVTDFSVGETANSSVRRSTASRNWRPAAVGRSSSSTSSGKAPSLASHPSRLLQRDRRSGSRSGRVEHHTGSGLRARPPSHVGDERAGARPRTEPEGDAATAHVQRRHGATPQFRLVAGGDERAAGHPHRRQVDDRTQVHSESGTPRMVEPARVDEQELGAQVECRQRGGQDRSLSAGQEPGHVRGGDTCGHDALGEDVVSLPGAARRRHAPEMVVGSAGTPIGRIAAPPRDGGRPRQVTRPARARATAGVRDEAPAEDGPLAGRQPGIGGQCARRCSGEAALELDELLVALRPSPGLGCHTAILADTRGRRPGRWRPR